MSVNQMCVFVHLSCQYRIDLDGECHRHRHRCHRYRFVVPRADEVIDLKMDMSVASQLADKRAFDADEDEGVGWGRGCGGGKGGGVDIIG